MSNFVRYKLVEKVRIRRGVSDKALVILWFPKLHFRIEREVVLFFKRLHVVAEYVVRTIGLRQGVGEQAVTHTSQAVYQLGHGQIDSYRNSQETAGKVRSQLFSTYRDVS